MKGLITRLLLFFIPLVLFCFLADHILTRSLRKSRSAEFSAWNDLEQGNLHSDVLIYGSSRSWRHIDPKILEDSMIGKSVYNLGMDGHNFFMQMLRHEIVLRNNQKPRCILLSLDITTLSKRKDLFDQDQFIPYLDDPAVLKATKTYIGFNFFDYYFPLVKFGGNRWLIGESVKCFLNKNDRSTDRYKGFLAVDSMWSNSFEKFKRLHPHGILEVMDPGSIKLFDEFLSDSKKRGIKVIMVYTPEFIEGQSYTTNRAAVFNIYNSFAEKHNVPFLDYSHDSISYNKKNFYDTWHLNKAGSALFSRKLASDLKKISL